MALDKEAAEQQARVVAIAEVTHEANKAYCQTIGDHSQYPWHNAPAWQRESAIAGVRSVLDGSAKTPEEQHESWCAHKRAAGWVFGEDKDEHAKTHPCLVSYADLPPEQRYKDVLFRAIVVALTSDVSVPVAAS